MCLLALFYRVMEDAPIVVGANREEAYARGGEPPRALEGACRAVAGLDPHAGGTWLHAQGPPDRTPYADVSELLRRLAAPAGGG